MERTDRLQRLSTGLFHWCSVGVCLHGLASVYWFVYIGVVVCITWDNECLLACLHWCRYVVTWVNECILACLHWCRCVFTLANECLLACLHWCWCVVALVSECLFVRKIFPYKHGCLG